MVGEYSDRGVLTPISWAEYENMSGRAGRFKLEKDFGRSIILAYDQFHFDSMWEEYVEGKEEKLLPALSQSEMDNLILDFVASGCAKSITHLKNLISSTLSYRNGFRFQELIGERVERLVDFKILLRQGDDLIFSSELGKTIAIKGISIQTAMDITNRLNGENDLDQKH